MLTILRSRARLFGPFVALLAATAGCQDDGEKGGGKGGGASGGTSGASGGTPQGGSSAAAGTSGATSGTGGASGATTGGSTSGGAGGSSSGAAGAAPGGAAGSTGGSAPGGSGGSTAGTGGGGDPCATAIFCDDFDDAPLNGSPATPWTLQRAGAGAILVDGTHHMSGTQAVKFTVPGQSDSAFIALRNAPVFPVAGNAFYGRVMLWLTSSPTATNPAVHWTLIEGSGLVPGQTYHAAYRLGGQHPVTGGNQLMANYETPDSYNGNGPASDCWHHASRVVVPVARWSCFEWQYDGPNNALTLWVDSNQVLSVRGMGDTANGDGCGNGQPATFPWTAPAFDTIRVGWDSYQPDSERTLWLDDVAISTTRVGCPSGMGQ